MAVLRDRPDLPPAQTIVYYDEPPVKAPPLLAVGPLAWMRKNLFATPFDAVLTVAGALILISLISGFITWAIGSANWLAVTRNFRLLLLGTFPPDQAWRVNLAALIVTAAIGFTLRAYGRITRPALIGLIALLITVAAAPPLIMALTPPPAAYLAAGDRPVQSGTVTERAAEFVGFIGRAGETVTVALDPWIGVDDVALANRAGFLDRAAQGLTNAAENRLADIRELDVLTTRLERDLLTDAQRATLTEARDGLTIAEPVSREYAVNRAAVTVQILDGGNDLAVLAEAELIPFDITASYEEPPLPDALTVTLPADGWYVLRKTSTNADAIALLTTTGIVPLIQRDLGGGRITYSRAVDDFETTAVRPVIDERDVPALFLADHQYQGVRPLSDYLRLLIAPLFELLARGLIPLAAVGAVGYVAADALTGRRRARPRVGERGAGAAALTDRGALTRSLVGVVWALALIALFLLPYGIPRLTPAELGVLLARFAWVGLLFFAGAALSQPWGRPLLAFGVVIGLALSAIGERLLDGITSGGMIGLIVWLAIGLYAARIGSQRGGRLTPRQLAFGAGGAFALGAVLLIVPSVLLSNTGGDLLPVIDTRRWGGLLLTMLLTIVAILASFPLGILLALGRRSDLPVVSWACTIYIELVRGVPLITVLFMAQLLVPLVNPVLANVDNVIRAMVGLTLFSGAYLAENVRGGLQSIPPGQEEAAKALGLAGWQVTLLITLPQALRAVIPALVGQCIALFKDTSLVALVGLTDLTGIARAVIAQTEFVGLQMEVYAFISVIYFVFSYLMAYVSRRIEASGSGAARRL